LPDVPTAQTLEEEVPQTAMRMSVVSLLTVDQLDPS
jgi:hypothetical protein